MRKQPHFLRRFAVTAAVALALCVGVSAQAASLVPLGRAVGIQMTTAGMLVADLAEVDTPGGKATPAKDAGLLPGDVICRIDGRDIASSADFLAAMDAAGDTMSVTVLRGGADGVSFSNTKADKGIFIKGGDGHARRHGRRHAAAWPLAARRGDRRRHAHVL